MPSGIYKRTNEHLRHMSNGMKGKNSKEPVFVKCKNCGIDFKIRPARINKAKFCTRDCMDKFRFKDLKTYKEINNERRSPKYKDWRRKVYNRDWWQCKINNEDCKGRLEVHHILSFREHPELKYDINNGITLCQFHHPRKREQEKRMIPIFKELLSVSKDKFCTASQI